jgi:4-diphosphocytidyl-2-C-methyl-D-erythritol kinase
MSVRRARLRSLAKINLDLRVLQRRSDGYHELRTVFQTISLGDTIVIEYQPAPRTEITLDDPLEIPDNLMVRAANTVLDALRVTARVDMQLRKRIPMGGGMGGGSSNAASILMALPVLAGRALAPERLQDIAAGLGSDVPFFLIGGTALGLGRGEEVYPLGDIAAEPILVVSAGLEVATGEAYRALGRGLTLRDWSRRINGFRLYVRALEEGRSAAGASSYSANDFEPVVFRFHPQLKLIRGKLSKMAAGVRMTGSGAGIVAIFRSVEDRERARQVFEQDRELRRHRLLAASLVGRRSYRRMWREQLREFLSGDTEAWLPLGRYGQ